MGGYVNISRTWECLEEDEDEQIIQSHESIVYAGLWPWFVLNVTGVSDRLKEDNRLLVEVKEQREKRGNEKLVSGQVGFEICVEGEERGEEYIGGNVAWPKIEICKGFGRRKWVRWIDTVMSSLPNTRNITGILISGLLLDNCTPKKQMSVEFKTSSCWSAQPFCKKAFCSIYHYEDKNTHRTFYCRKECSCYSSGTWPLFVQRSVAKGTASWSFVKQFPVVQIQLRSEPKIS